MPAYRWILIGPRMSGSAFHTDVMSSSAWNAQIIGRKRWALYPPGKVPRGSRYMYNISDDGYVGPRFGQSKGCPKPPEWFGEIYPTLPPQEKPLECVTQPGDVIFIPFNWWHCVINLEFSVAVTENFVTPTNLASVVDDLLSSFPAQAQLFVSSLVSARPRFVPTLRNDLHSLTRADRRAEYRRAGYVERT